ncbi:MAG: hypothetical protein HFG33_06040 [Bacilli bacterium]|nr:hypothetical protein [Bacilli bacterium]
MKDKQIIINLIEGIPNSKKIFAISGRDLGFKQRKYHKLDELEENNDIIEVKIADNIIFLSSSFFLGMFGDSVRKCGSKEKFKEKFIFKTNGQIESNIEDGINDALKNINPLI